MRYVLFTKLRCYHSEPSIAEVVQIFCIQVTFTRWKIVKYSLKLVHIYFIKYFAFFFLVHIFRFLLVYLCLFEFLSYRIGPFEVESALIEHQAVAEAAVVSSPDSLRGEVR